MRLRKDDLTNNSYGYIFITYQFGVQVGIETKVIK
jgi:hypothetical protein